MLFIHIVITNKQVVEQWNVFRFGIRSED